MERIKVVGMIYILVCGAQYKMLLAFRSEILGTVGEGLQMCSLYRFANFFKTIEDALSFRKKHDSWFMFLAEMIK